MCFLLRLQVLIHSDSFQRRIRASLTNHHQLCNCREPGDQLHPSQAYQELENYQADALVILSFTDIFSKQLFSAKVHTYYSGIKSYCR